MDRIFFLTLTIIFLSALVGAYLKRRSKDLCLKDFHGYHVQIEFKDGQFAWGVLQVFATGLELIFAKPHQNRNQQTEASFLVFEDKLANIQAIYRFQDELTPRLQRARLSEIEKSYHPGPVRRLKRAFRNFINTFRDAINQSLGLTLTKLKTTSQVSLLKTQDARIAQMGETALSSFNNAYDPMLEKYIGHKVVAIETRPSGVNKHHGILKEYTARWVEVLDCQKTMLQKYHLSELERIRYNKNLQITLSLHLSEDDPNKLKMEIHIKNAGESEIKFISVEAENYSKPFNALLKPHEAQIFLLSDMPQASYRTIDPKQLPYEVDLRMPVDGNGMEVNVPDVTLVFEATREMDICLPRAVGVVQYGGEPLKLPTPAEDGSD
jgi:hypothetical protein